MKMFYRWHDKVCEVVFFGILYCCTAGAAADTGWTGAPACAKSVDVSDVKAVLTIKQQDYLRNVYGVYAEQCNGGLYLIDLQGAKKMWLINESWWFETLESAQWIAPGNQDAIVVKASFITGIGPTGVQPFWVKIQLNRIGEDWLAMEPVSLSEPVSEPKFSGDLWVADNQAALNKLLEREYDDIGRIEVDFNTSRFVIGSVWLTSGSMRITDVRVIKTKNAYMIEYDTTHPSIGTTDMRHVVIYAIVPKDGLPVRLADGEKDRGDRIRTQTGFLYR